MDGLTSEMLFSFIFIVIFGGIANEALCEFRKKFCLTVVRRRCLVAAVLIITVYAVYYFPPNKLLPAVEFDDLSVTEGVLQYEVNEGRRMTSYSFSLKGKKQHFIARLCDEPKNFVEKLAGKKVKLWLFDNIVYQVAVGQEVVYDFSVAQKRLRTVNAMEIMKYLAIFLQIMALIFVGIYSLTEFVAKKRAEGTTSGDGLVFAEKEEVKKLTAEQFIITLLLTAVSALTVKYCFLSDTAASNVRLARIAAFQTMFYPSYWVGGYQDTLAYFQRAWELAQTEDEQRMVACAWYKDLHGVYVRMHNKEWKRLENKKNFATGDKTAAKMAKYVLMSRDIYTAVGREDKFRQDYGLSFMWQADFKYNLQDYRAAGELIDKSLAIKNNWSDSYRLKACVDVTQGRWDAALTNINRAIELDDNDVYAHYMRYNILLKMGNVAAATADEQYAKKYVEENKHNERKK